MDESPLESIKSTYHTLPIYQYLDHSKTKFVSENHEKESASGTLNILELTSNMLKNLAEMIDIANEDSLSMVEIN